jgi:hypothetical protein
MELKVAGLTLHNLRYADDATLVAGSVSEHRKLILALVKTYMFPVAQESSETWFLKKAARQTIAAQELSGNQMAWESLLGHRKSHGKTS